MQSHGTEDDLRILVVDDDEALRRVVCRVLRLAGIVVEDFSDGELAFRRLREASAAAGPGGPNGRTFDGAVIDLRMPGWDGVRTARALRTVEPDLPIVVWSGGAPQALADEARLLGLHAFLEKPCDPAELVRVVRSLRGRYPIR